MGTSNKLIPANTHNNATYQVFDPILVTGWYRYSSGQLPDFNITSRRGISGNFHHLGYVSRIAALAMTDPRYWTASETGTIETHTDLNFHVDLYLEEGDVLSVQNYGYGTASGGTLSFIGLERPIERVEPFYLT